MREPKIKQLLFQTLNYSVCLNIISSVDKKKETNHVVWNHFHRVWWYYWNVSSQTFLFGVFYAINLQGRNIWNTPHVTDMSKAISAAESETSSLCEWRQHPSTLHENNLPALFNLHTSSPPPSLLYLQNSLRWDAMRLLSCLAFVWKSNWELLFSLIHFHANKEVVFLFSCKCLFYRRRQV